VYNVPFAT